MRTLSALIFVLFIAFASNAQLSFYQDISAAAGINNTGGNFGISVGDYDNDGWEDVYVSINDMPNKLYRNNGDSTFTDVAIAAGVADPGISMCSVWLDIDNNGWLDLYVGNRNSFNRLYYNNGDGTFTDISFTAGTISNGHVRSINAADVDNNGLIDIYVANLGTQNVLYINNGNNTFTDLVYLYNAVDMQIAQAAIFFDYDNDRDQDLYITHDAYQTFILYQNNGSGYFTNVAAASGTDLMEQGMGVDVADFDNNGFLDLYVTNLYPNSLLSNNGNGSFTDISATCGMGDPGMSWGTTWLDYNNDGLVDNYMVNDSYFSGSDMPNLLYKNMGDNTFQVASDSMPVASPYAGYGSACGDFNNDGKIDLFVANRGQVDGNQLFLNSDPDPGHWVKVKPIGTTSNRDGVGTRVEIYLSEDEKMIDEVNAGNGFASQSSHTLHFGLGEQTMIHKIKLLWPSGLEEEYFDVMADQLLVLTEGEGSISTSVEPVEIEYLDAFNVYPNPVASDQIVQIAFDLKSSANVNLEIFSVTGKRLVSLVNGTTYPAGNFLETWQPPASGLFLIKMEIDGQVITRKVVVDR